MTAAIVDLSVVTAMTDDALAEAIARADVAFARARLADPRRATLTYSDAKTAVTVLTRERRRREENAAVAEAERIVAEAAAAVCTDQCRAATSHASLCECRGCHGDNHGADHRAGRERAVRALEARFVVPGFTQQMLDVIGDDESF